MAIPKILSDNFKGKMSLGDPVVLQSIWSLKKGTRTVNFR